jgi:hypothetical protein
MSQNPNKGLGPNPLLKNIANSLFFDTDGNVSVRTSLGTGTVSITGPVTIPATVNVASSSTNPVHVHVMNEAGSAFTSTVYQGTTPWNVTGTVILSTSTVVSVSVIETAPELYSFNNFGLNIHRGWTFSDTLIPMFSIRAKTSATKTMKVINYDIGNNNNNNSTVGYVWLENATITGTTGSWTSLNTEAEYRFYTDAYGTNTPNGFTGGTQRHAGIIVGKTSSAESDIADIVMTANGVTLTLCLIRMDGSNKLDVWAAVDVGVYN